MKKLFKIQRRQRRLPVQAVCRNCGASLDGPYCSQCGQHLMSGARRTVGDLTYNMTENMFAVDTKTLVTLRYLLFAPGKLTKEYMQGRIVSYVHPSKLFWFISLILFTILTFKIDVEMEKDEARKNKEQLEEVAAPAKSVGDISKTAAMEAIDNITVTSETDSIKLAKAKKLMKMKEADDDEEKEIKKQTDQFISSIKTYTPYISFFLIPLFAMFVKLLFNRKENFYVDYLAFSMHFHAFVFLLIIILLGVNYFFPELDFPEWLVFVPALYFLWSVWVAFRPKPWRLVWGTTLVVLLYGIALITFTTLFVLNLVYMVGWL